MTTMVSPPWQELFAQQSHARLGLLARTQGSPNPVHSLADEEILLLGQAGEAARLSKRPQATPQASPRLVVVTPASKATTAEEFAQAVHDARALHPDSEFEGFGPSQLPLAQRFVGLDRGVILGGQLAHQFTPHTDLSQSLPDLPLTVVLVYSPEVTAEALGQAVGFVQGLHGVVGVVPLPAGAGDRIPLPGLTTSGPTDVAVISVLRMLLPPKVRVRACWAALGWKVAQSALAYGADEIAGWTAAESLAYTGRVRAASRVERQELNEGLEEARRENLPWPRRGGAR